MEKALTFGRSLAIAAGATLLTTAAIAAASTGDLQKPGGDFEKPDFLESVTRDVEFNEDLNTVTITMTSDDAEAVEFLQSQKGREARGKFADEITVTQELISNGVQVTITADNEEAFADISEHASQEPGQHQKGAHKGGERGEKPEFADASQKHLDEKAEQGFQRGPHGENGEGHEIPHAHPEEDDLVQE